MAMIAMTTRSSIRVNPARDRARTMDGLVAAVDRLVVAPLLRQIRLIDPAAFVIVAVLVVLAVAQLLGPPVMAVAQMLRHRQRAAVLDVVARPCRWRACRRSISGRWRCR